MNRSEHLEWCKKRALEYLDNDDIHQAWASMCSDLGKHEETKGHFGIDMGMMMVMSNQFSSSQQMREFIEGFN